MILVVPEQNSRSKGIQKGACTTTKSAPYQGMCRPTHKSFGKPKYIEGSSPPTSKANAYAVLILQQAGEGVRVRFPLVVLSSFSLKWVLRCLNASLRTHGCSTADRSCVKLPAAPERRPRRSSLGKAAPEGCPHSADCSYRMMKRLLPCNSGRIVWRRGCRCALAAVDFAAAPAATHAVVQGFRRHRTPSNFPLCCPLQGLSRSPCGLPPQTGSAQQGACPDRSKVRKLATVRNLNARQSQPSTAVSVSHLCMGKLHASPPSSLPEITPSLEKQTSLHAALVLVRAPPLFAD